MPTFLLRLLVRPHLLEDMSLQVLLHVRPLQISHRRQPSSRSVVVVENTDLKQPNER